MLVPLLLALAVVLLFVPGTFAWLSKEQLTTNAYTALSDFEVEGVLSFNGKEYAPGDEIAAAVSFDPNAENYIGKLKYVVRYSGVSPACIRVQVLEQWVNRATNEILAADYLNYAVPADGAPERIAPTDASPSLPAASAANDSAILAEPGAWVDRRAADFCYYYSVPVQPNVLPVSRTADGTVTAIADGVVELTLIDQTGADTDAMLGEISRDTTQLTLIFNVEAVQPNRLREFFGIDALPTP